MSKDLKTIGDRLKHLRKIEGMTQKDIADRTNIKRGNVSHYENNKIMPSAETIIELSKLFKVSTDWLLTGKGSTEEVAQEDNVSSSILGELTNEDIKILQLFRQLNDRDKIKIEGIIETKINESKQDKRGLSSNYRSGEEAATKERKHA